MINIINNPPPKVIMAAKELQPVVMELNTAPALFIHDIVVQDGSNYVTNKSIVHVESVMLKLDNNREL
jgi:hypothetical protein